MGRDVRSVCVCDMWRREVRGRCSVKSSDSEEYSALGRRRDAEREDEL